MSQGQLPPTELRRRDRFFGLLIVGGAFLLSLPISLWAKHRSEPERSMPSEPATIEGISGWPRAVDPIRNLARARELTRRSLFRGFIAEGVKSDGTIDLSQPATGANIRYSFQSPPGHGPQPPRQVGVVPRRDRCGRQSVRVREVGIYAEPDQAEVICPRQEEEALPDPECSLERIWRVAIERGAPEDALARVQYYPSISGPAYRFQLLDNSVTFALEVDCETELSLARASGHVP